MGHRILTHHAPSGSECTDQDRHLREPAVTAAGGGPGGAAPVSLTGWPDAVNLPRETAAVTKPIRELDRQMLHRYLSRDVKSTEGPEDL